MTPFTPSFPSLPLLPSPHRSFHPHQSLHSHYSLHLIAPFTPINPFSSITPFTRTISFTPSLHLPPSLPLVTPPFPTPPIHVPQTTPLYPHPTPLPTSSATTPPQPPPYPSPPQLGVVTNLVHAMGNSDHADSQRQAALTLEVYLQYLQLALSSATSYEPINQCSSMLRIVLKKNACLPVNRETLIFVKYTKIIKKIILQY